MIKSVSKRMLSLMAIMLLLSLSLTQGCASKAASASALDEKHAAIEVVDQAGQGEQEVFDFKQIYRK